MDRSEQSAGYPASPYRLENRPMPTQSQLNEIATTLLKLKRQIFRLADGQRQKARTEAVRQLLCENQEELLKDEQTEAHKSPLRAVPTERQPALPIISKG